MTTQATGHRVLTGDTPTGNLHLGHWVGSVKRRVQMQDTHECYFLVANMHAFTTRADKADEVRANLEALRAQTVPFESVIVVDNASSDETRVDEAFSLREPVHAIKSPPPGRFQANALAMKKKGVGIFAPKVLSPASA